MPHHCELCHIDLDMVSVRRGGQVLLQDVSMHIHCGQLTVLIGQNGAGKTTLIKALLGQIPHLFLFAARKSAEKKERERREAERLESIRRELQTRLSRRPEGQASVRHDPE